MLFLNTQVCNDEEEQISGKPDTEHFEGAGNWYQSIWDLPQHGVNDATFFNWKNGYGGMILISMQ